jgi:hypothetical protein
MIKLTTPLSGMDYISVTALGIALVFLVGLWIYTLVFTSRSHSVPWKETLSEWGGCAGLGLIPLLCSVVTYVLATDPQFILEPKLIYRELILFCIVTNFASIVIFISKFNLLQVIRPGMRLIPTGFIFSILAVTLVCAFVYIATSLRDFDALAPMVSCLLFTLTFSLWAERRIGIIARD